jgi:predicted metal-dependent phosphoesterase TrpH
MIDLHAHTNASDGLLSPAALVDLAVERGLTALAITDHDSTEGVAPALAHARGLTVVPGVEMSSDVPGGECHILGYFVPAGPGSFQDMLRAFRIGRVSRAEEMVKRLTAAGAPISWQRVQEIAGEGAIARPHVAQALIEAGHATSTSDAFDRWIGSGRPGYVPRVKLTPVDAVRAIVEAGGAAAIAHPVLGAWTDATLAGVEQRVVELREAGLAGIETYYTGYPAALVQALESLADRHGLVCTGGSDFHGPGRGHGELGTVAVPDEVVDQLRQRAGAKAR